MAVEFAQASQVNAAYTATPGTAPTTGWQQLLVNPSGTQNFHPEFVEVVANPQDPSMVKQLGEQVGENAAPALVVDWSWMIALTFAYGLLRSAPKAPWGQMPLRPTSFNDNGVSADSITVSGAATLPSGTLIEVLGSKYNDGVYKLGASSNATTLNVPSGSFVAETVSPTGSVIVRIIGFEFSDADLSVNSSGHLASSSQDLTVFGLVPGSKVLFRASANAHSFPTGGGVDEGLHYAYVAETVTTNLIQLKNRTFPTAAISGTGKTIRLYFGICLRNVPFGHADHVREPAHWLELVDPSVGAADATTYTYAESAVLSTLTMPLATEQKIEATLNFMARKIDEFNESADRLAGASAAYAPTGSAQFHTQCASMLAFRVVVNEDDTELISPSGEVQSGTFTISHNPSPVKGIGGCGTSQIVLGDIDVGLTGMSVHFDSAEKARAIRARTICRAEMLMKSASGSISIDLPTGRLTGGSRDFPENAPVMINMNFVPHGDTTNANVICAINLLGWIPTEDPA